MSALGKHLTTSRPSPEEPEVLVAPGSSPHFASARFPSSSAWSSGEHASGQPQGATARAERHLQLLPSALRFMQQPGSRWSLTQPGDPPGHRSGGAHPFHSVSTDVSLFSPSSAWPGKPLWPHPDVVGLCVQQGRLPTSRHGEAGTTSSLTSKWEKGLL